MKRTRHYGVTMSAYRRFGWRNAPLTRGCIASMSGSHACFSSQMCMWGSGGFANKGSDQLFRMDLWVSAGCWYTAHKPGNITMRLRGAYVGSRCGTEWYSTCGSRRGVGGAIRRCPDAFYFSMTTALTFWSVLSTSLSPRGFRASPAIVPPCEAFGEAGCLALGKRFPRFCFNYGDVKPSFI